MQIKKKQEQLLKVRNFLPPQSQEPEIHLLEKLVNSAEDADKKIESANKGELKENGGKTLEKYTTYYMLTPNMTFFKPEVPALGLLYPPLSVRSFVRPSVPNLNFSTFQKKLQIHTRYLISKFRSQFAHLIAILEEFCSHLNSDQILQIFHQYSDRNSIFEEFHSHATTRILIKILQIF